MDKLFHNPAFNPGDTAENYEIRDGTQIVTGVVPGSTLEIASRATADPHDYRVTREPFADALGLKAGSTAAGSGVEQLLEPDLRFVDAGESAAG